MSAGGKFTQYINPVKPSQFSQFDEKVAELLDYLSQVGILSSKNDIFIVKRRFNMLTKDLKGKPAAIQSVPPSRRLETSD